MPLPLLHTEGDILWGSVGRLGAFFFLWTGKDGERSPTTKNTNMAVIGRAERVSSQSKCGPPVFRWPGEMEGGNACK